MKVRKFVKAVTSPLRVDDFARQAYVEAMLTGERLKFDPSTAIFLVGSMCSGTTGFQEVLSTSEQQRILEWTHRFGLNMYDISSLSIMTSTSIPKKHTVEKDLNLCHIKGQTSYYPPAIFHIIIIPH